MEYILEMEGISKSFSGITVLDDITFSLKPGEVHALMGENGAGKSTLMKILMGIYSADAGRIVLQGKARTISSAKDAIENGISMIHQELNPILDMNVAENLFVGRELARYGVVDKKAMQRATSKLFDELSINLNAAEIMRNLSVAQMQMVEIAKAISLNAKIIIMDEPTSAITEKEVEVLFERIRILKNQGVAIIYISHKLDEIFRIADTITVLRDGKLIGSGRRTELTRDRIISMMVGREIKEIYPKIDTKKGDELLRVEHLTRKNKIRDVSFSLHRGEVLGVAGLMGSGRSELVETIFGLAAHSAGKIFVAGKEVFIKHPQDAIKHKMALITEDRKHTGLNLAASVEHNISIVGLNKLAKWGLINKAKEAATADGLIAEMKIKATDRSQRVMYLSGGNQQKVVLSKWLMNDPQIIIFDEPTRGIDVGAKRDIYILIGELARQGKGVIVISSEMPEVMGISDRILVMCDGKLSGELKRNNFNQETIMKYASNHGEIIDYDKK